MCNNKTPDSNPYNIILHLINKAKPNNPSHTTTTTAKHWTTTQQHHAIKQHHYTTKRKDHTTIQQGHTTYQQQLSTLSLHNNHSKKQSQHSNTIPQTGNFSVLAVRGKLPSPALLQQQQQYWTFTPQHNNGTFHHICSIFAASDDKGHSSNETQGTYLTHPYQVRIFSVRWASKKYLKTTC